VVLNLLFTQQANAAEGAHGPSLDLAFLRVTAQVTDTVHGPYSALTAACAACHRTHSAQGPSLMVTADDIELCLTCHNGTGSVYNSVEGVIQVNGKTAPSAAGPIALVSQGGPATSAHLIGNAFDAPGGPLSKSALACGDCHDPHGSPNFRMIRTDLTWNNVNTSIAFTATLAHAGTVSETVKYLSGSVTVCTACHIDYGQHSGGKFSDGTRHDVGVKVTSDYTPGNLPLENGKLVCLTCHYAHGTRVTNTAASGLGSTSTALKRQGNWSLCSQCHFDQPE